MVYCPNCGTAVLETSAFCANCGAGLPVANLAGSEAWQPPPGQALSAVVPGVPAYVARPEDTGRRVLAYLIDVVPMLLLFAFHFVPVIGWMFYGALHIAYWLLRDIGGASLGKMVLGSYVTNTDGGPSTDSQRILRNVPLALPGVLGLIPVIGFIFEFGLAILIFSTEAILLLVTGKRIGDRLAGTAVFRR